MTQTETIIATCARPDGATTAEICAATDRQTDQISTRLGQLHKAGRLFSALVPENFSCRRWFASQAHRDAWQQANPTPTPEQKHQAKKERWRAYDRTYRAVRAKPKEIRTYGDRPGTLGNRCIPLLSGEPMTAATAGAKLGESAASVYRALMYLCEAGRAWSGVAGGERHFFVSAEAGEPWVKAEAARRQKLRQQKERERVRSRAVAARLNRPAPVKLAKAAPVTAPKPVLLDMPPDMSRAKVTVCPSPTYDRRYELEPGTRVLGGFSTAGIGRYLEVA